MADFGKTWWGEQWLNSLSDIDYSNRLPRGRSYARNGYVKEINIKDNSVKAKVRGSRRTPYKVEVTVPKFNQAQKDILINLIKDNPLLLSQLLNRELPPELNDIAKKNKIDVFPSSWKDFDMSCSCPDWAVPCKHIASVIYIISAEIDKNPFIVFQLHGLDIFKELEKVGLPVENNNIKVPAIKDFFLTPEKIKEKKQHAEIKKETKWKNKGYSCDFSIIPDMQETIFSILEEKPIFYGKDFKPILRKAYRALARFYKRELQEIAQEDVKPSVYEKYQNAEIIFHNETYYFDTILYADDDEKHFSREKGFIRLIEFINNIPAKYVGRLSDALKAIYYCYHFSLKLIEQSAFIPQLLQLADNSYTVRWIPAAINEEVEEILSRLEKLVSPEMVQVMDTSTGVKHLNKHEQIITISSMFLGHYFLMATKKPNDRYYKSSDDKIDGLFFTNSSQTFNELGENEMPNAIYQWISRFYITHQDYVPVIKVDTFEESGDDFYTVELLIEDKNKSLQAPIEFNEFMTDKKFVNVKTIALQPLANLAKDFDGLKPHIASNGTEDLIYGADEFTEVLLKILPTVKLLGIKILLPNALKNLVKPKTSLLLRQNESSSDEKSYLSLDEMLNFEWQVAIGDKTISVKEFQKLSKGLSGVVNIKGQYVLIDQNEIQKMLDNLSDDKQLSRQELLKSALTEEYEEAKISISAKARKTIQELLKVEEIETSESLKAELRPYQERGYQWLYNNSKIGFGSIIADDMGLGKTIQVITMLLNFKEEQKLNKNKALIIVPTTLLSNWEKEIGRFAPSLSMLTYHGLKRELNYTDFDITITSYGMIRRDIEKFQKIKWATVIIDEAQNIKNPTTEQTKAIKKLKAPVKIAMSGTPVENRLSEYWSIFDFTNKGYLGSLKYFKKEFSAPIEKYGDEKQLNKFKKITSPFILRRLKTDKTIISDLPYKIENDKYVSLTKEQTAIYKNVVDSMMKEVATLEKDDIKRAGLVFKLMTALKQICNHPSQFLKKEDFNPDLSGKATMLLNILQSIYESNEKVLIFTQYREMGEIIKEMIEDHFGRQAQFLHGGVSRKKRDQMVEDFQDKNNVKTFILSIKAGGTGLNLTKANHVIHYDLWWNPAVEAQATDRAFRIGQEKNVMVYRLITKDTFEEKINEMLQAKKELANLTVSAGEKWIGNLSDNELSELVNI
ncbi:MAG: DEAD/DEAH box helicase [Bacteroidota bacterium]